ncbi:MAG: hypothetical protein ABWZ27_10670 [Aestuariivirgaceae bacterium]
MAQRLVASGRIPTIRIEAGKKTHTFTRPGAVRAAVDAEFKGKR